MTESKSHKTVAKRIAAKYKTQYNEGQGVDIQTAGIAVEVETADTVSEAMRQLQGHKKPVYIAGTNQEAVEKALEITKGTTVGVMDNKGNIVKRSTRKK
jgi:formylmethanofuran dehydrogenase subunit B